MNMTVIEKNGVRCLSGIKGEKLISTEPDINPLISECYAANTDRLLLYKENLPQDFVRLGSGQAGWVLGKFSVYKLKAAVVVDEADMNKGKFSEMVNEVNRFNSMFHVFTDAAQAEEWLLKTS